MHQMKHLSAMTLQESNTQKESPDSASVHSNPGPSVAGNSSSGATSEKMDITVAAASDDSPAPSAHMLVFAYILYICGVACLYVCVCVCACVSACASDIWLFGVCLMIV